MDIGNMRDKMKFNIFFMEEWFMVVRGLCVYLIKCRN